MQSDPQLVLKNINYNSNGYDGTAKQRSVTARSPHCTALPFVMAIFWPSVPSFFCGSLTKCKRLAKGGVVTYNTTAYIPH
eukprot:scaffold11765_cov78-Skeletonema_marinoi.AAC.2